ncbi:MAG: flagellar filament capping protein FliD [Planctomycetes bacterium]|nr:flagellar filament capping protein FliD [Planctomycetota bacterium]
MGGFAIDGLVSNLDTQSIIQQLLAIERRPVDQVQTKISKAEEQRSAYLDLSSRLLALQGTSTRLGNGSIFDKTKTTSSNESILTATGTSASTLGSFNFRVGSLASIEQHTSSGFASKSDTVGAGSMIIELGDSRINKSTSVDDFNGFQGIDHGRIRITDGNNASAVVDLRFALTAEDIVDAINNTGLDVTAGYSTDGRSLTLATTTSLSVSEVDGGSTAADLGFTGATATIGAPGTLTGNKIVKITEDTALSRLGNGQGVDSGTTSTIRGFIINNWDAGVTKTTISFGSDPRTIGDVIDAINTTNSEGGTKDFVASISDDGSAISIRYAAANANNGITVIENGGTTANDLGIRTAGSFGADMLTRELIGDEYVALDFTDRGGNTTNLYLEDRSTYAHSANVDALTAATFQAGSVQIGSLNRNGINITDGSTSYVNIENRVVNSAGAVAAGSFGNVFDPTVSTTDKFTISGTFNATAPGAGENHVLFSVTGTGGEQIQIAYNDANQLVATLDEDGTGTNYTTITSSANLTYGAGTGNTFAVEFDLTAPANPQVRFTINNATDAYNAGADTGTGFDGVFNANAATEIHIGSDDGTAIAGRQDVNDLTLADLRIYGRELTAAEIAGVSDFTTDMQGKTLVSTLDSAKLSQLNGGTENAQTTTGVDGSMRITDTAGTSFEIDTSAIADSGRLMLAIERAALFSGSSVQASVSESNLGLKIEDTVDSGGTLSVTDGVTVNGDGAATRLGLNVAGNAVNDYTITNQNVQRQYIFRESRLETLNGGNGITLGKFQITSTAGVTYDVDLVDSSNPVETIEDVFAKIAAATASKVSGRINDTGDGILLVDTAGGGGELSISELSGGKSATQLGILRETGDAATTIDGSFEKTVTITSTDDIVDVQNSIADLDFPITATVINDGSAGTPYRLNLLSDNSGTEGFFSVYTTGSTSLSMSETTRARDAAMLYGSTGGGSSPVLVRSNTNSFLDLIPDVNLTVQSADPDKQVTVSVSRDTTGIVDEVETFVEDFNSIVERIQELTDYNTETKERGVLLGDATARRIMSDLQLLVINAVDDLPVGSNSLTNIGFRLNREGGLELSKSTFLQKLAANFESVRDIFIQAPSLSNSTRVADLLGGQGLGDIAGNDMRITAKDGTIFDIDISNTTYMSQILQKIQSAADTALGAGNFTVQISTSGKKLELIDGTGGAGELKLASIGSSTVLSSLGFTKTKTEATAADDTLESSSIDIFNRSHGIGGRLSDRLNFITDPIDGTIASRTDGIDNEIEDYERQIERLEERIAAVEERLQREFTQLEVYLGESQNQMQRLSAQLGSLSGLRR